MPTLRDIGKNLGLSPATVSRALNGFPEVNEKTRRRIEEMARRLDYKPNQIARKLVTGRSGMIGLVVQKPQDLATDTTFFGVVTGISTCLAERDIDLVLHVAVDEDEVAPYRRLTAKGAVDGFILNTPTINDRRIAYLEQQGAHFVVHGRSDAEVGYAYYDIDNKKVSVLAAELLCNLGHRRIALLNGPAERSYAIDRRLGLAETLASRRLHTPEAFIMSGPLSEHHGYVSALRALSGVLGPAPTAFVCASTLIAVGALRAIADRGLQVPHDISVIAHDDGIPQVRATGFSPTLTVTRSPLTDACAPLAEIIVALTQSSVRPQAVQRVGTPEFIIGGSTGPVRTGETDEWPN